MNEEAGAKGREAEETQEKRPQQRRRRRVVISIGATSFGDKTLECEPSVGLKSLLCEGIVSRRRSIVTDALAAMDDFLTKTAEHAPEGLSCCRGLCEHKQEVGSCGLLLWAAAVQSIVCSQEREHYLDAVQLLTCIHRQLVVLHGQTALQDDLVGLITALRLLWLDRHPMDVADLVAAVNQAFPQDRQIQLPGDHTLIALAARSREQRALITEAAVYARSRNMDSQVQLSEILGEVFPNEPAVCEQLHSYLKTCISSSQEAGVWQAFKRAKRGRTPTRTHRGSPTGRRTRLLMHVNHRGKKVQWATDCVINAGTPQAMQNESADGSVRLHTQKVPHHTSDHDRKSVVKKARRNVGAVLLPHHLNMSTAHQQRMENESGNLERQQREEQDADAEEDDDDEDEDGEEDDEKVPDSGDTIHDTSKLDLFPASTQFGVARESSSGSGSGSQQSHGDGIEATEGSHPVTAYRGRADTAELAAPSSPTSISCIVSPEDERVYITQHPHRLRQPSATTSPAMK